MYKDINDYELLYLIAENNEDAYNSMCLKYNDMVKIETNKLYQKCKYLGISKEDIYQAGLYGLTQAIDNFDERGGTLFYTCASVFITREIQTFIRNKSRNKHNVLSDSISLDKEIDSDGNAFLTVVESDASTQEVYSSYVNEKKIVDLKYKMPLFDSLVFELRLNNFNNKEICTLLNVKYKMVDNSITKIKNILKKELNEIELF